jgi:hypothetical protein
MKKLLRLVITVLLLALLPGCRWPLSGDDSDDCPDTQLPPHNTDRVTIEQGMWGDVWFWEGDFMPICPSGTVTAVSREMRIHELTSMNDVESPGPGAFYTAIHTALVATATGDSQGFFEVELEPGTYSVFAIEDSMFYANGFDGMGHIWPVTVNEGQVTGITFSITYLSTW